MKDHFEYLKYVLRHKFYVFIACIKLKVPLHLAILHDHTKFSSEEWFPYVHSFYNPDGSKRSVRDQTGYYDPTKVSMAFSFAWLHHQKCNKHHWQYWILVNDSEPTQALEIPRAYLLEMVADWIGAGMAIMGNPNPKNWYFANKNKMVLHPESRKQVEEILDGIELVT